MIAGVDVGDEAFDAIGDEFDRTLEQLGECGRRHLVRIRVHLDSKRAADVLGQDANLMLLQSKMLGEQVLHHVRRLRALVNGETTLALVPIGEDGTRLVGDAGVAAEMERRLDHRVGVAEAFVRIAADMHALEAQIIAELRMNDRGAGLERSFRVSDGGQRFVAYFDQLAGILGLGTAARDNRAHRLALPASPLDRDCVLRRRFDAFEVGEHADPGRDHFGELGAGDDGDDTGRLGRRRRRDRDNARMRMGRAHEGHMRRARQRQVADELRTALGEAREIRPRHRAADVRVGPVEGGDDWRGIVGDPHGCLSRCQIPGIRAGGSIRVRRALIASLPPESSPPLPPRPRSPDIPCSGNSCRRDAPGFARGSERHRGPAVPVRSAACPACSNRIAARCAR